MSVAIGILYLAFIALVVLVCWVYTILDRRLVSESKFSGDEAKYNSDQWVELSSILESMLDGDEELCEYIRKQTDVINANAKILTDNNHLTNIIQCILIARGIDVPDVDADAANPEVLYNTDPTTVQ